LTKRENYDKKSEFTTIKEEPMNPDDLKYHKEHIWVRMSGRKLTIGITDYAQDALGDIVYVDLPEVDTDVEANSEIGEIESTKATSSIISPVSGRVTDVNDDLSESPEIINEDPYGKGWIAVIETEDVSEAEDLMDSGEYTKYIEEEAK
jgi:glycine cleavage system H protein